MSASLNILPLLSKREKIMSKKELDQKQPKENRESAQKKVDKVVSTLSLTKDERRKLHDAITGNDYMEYQEILKLAKSMFEPIHVKSSKGEKPRW
jgi:dsDNA-specific endonuclease/ATPase MutS2